MDGGGDCRGYGYVKWKRRSKRKRKRRMKECVVEMRERDGGLREDYGCGSGGRGRIGDGGEEGEE